METVKKTYEEPTVQKVEFDFKTRMAWSGYDTCPGDGVYDCDPCGV
jgi:hypothetical protein